MSEKQKIALSELGVQPFTLLRARAEKTLNNGAELDNVSADELQDWLYAYFKDSIQPLYEDARHATLHRVLESAETDLLVKPEVEQWFMGYIPAVGQGSWHPGIVRAVISLDGTNDMHQLAQFELDQRRDELSHDAVADEAYFRSQAIGIFSNAGATVHIEPHDLIHEVPAHFRPTQNIVRVPGGYAISRGNKVPYRVKPQSYLDTYRTNKNGVEQPLTVNEAFGLCVNLMAHTEILHEYGIVIKNIGERITVDPLITQQQNESTEL